MGGVRVSQLVQAFSRAPPALPLKLSLFAGMCGARWLLEGTGICLPVSPWSTFNYVCQSREPDLCVLSGGTCPCCYHRPCFSGHCALQSYIPPPPPPHHPCPKKRIVPSGTSLCFLNSLSPQVRSWEVGACRGHALAVHSQVPQSQFFLSGPSWDLLPISLGQALRLERPSRPRDAEGRWLHSCPTAADFCRD